MDLAEQVLLALKGLLYVARPVGRLHANGSFVKNKELGDLCRMVAAMQEQLFEAVVETPPEDAVPMEGLHPCGGSWLLNGLSNWSATANVVHAICMSVTQPVFLMQGLWRSQSKQQDQIRMQRCVGSTW